MDFKKLTQKYGFHLLTILLFLITSVIYFKPAIEGYTLKQHDIEQYIGASREIADYNRIEGKTPLWTNSMFSGMPSAQISTKYPGNYFKSVLNFVHTSLNTPIGFLFLYLIGFYIFGCCVGLNKWISLVGAFAFAFSSYNLIILQAGHVTKANAIALLLPMLGAFVMAFRDKKAKWGVILFGIFLALQLSANHLQITYYSLFVFLFLGIYFLFKFIRDRKIKQFFVVCTGLIMVGLIAVMINIGNIIITKDYAKHTIRGGNDLTLNVDGTKIDQSNENGLDLDYITNWSYGKGETFTLLSPYVKGSGSVMLNQTPFEDMVAKTDASPEAQNFISNYYAYWGEQPFTSGPVYFGAIVVFLALLSLFFLESKIKWAYFAGIVLTIMLSWGKNMMGFTEFFAHYVPGYNKFRAVTIILSITSMLFPILAALILQQFYVEREKLKEKKKKFLIFSAGFIVFLLMVKFVGLGDGYLSANDKKQLESVTGNEAQVRANVLQQINAMSDADLAKNGIDRNNTAQINQIVSAQIERNSKTYDIGALKEVRKSIFNYSMNRTIIYVILSIGVLSLLFYTEVDKRIVVVGLGVLIAIDLISVDINYLNSKEDDSGNYVYWEPRINSLYPELATDADLKIMTNELSVNPALNQVMSQAEKLGEEEANELAVDEKINENKIIEYEKFRALNRKTNYRVLDLSTNPFNSSRTSYFHKSIGGYHGAKLRRYQNLIEHHLSGSLNFKVLEMLNAKYIIQQNGQMVQNPNALGNAWMVRKVKTVATPDDEINALGNSYSISSKPVAKLLVNGKEIKSTTVTDKERIQVVLQKDTLEVKIPEEFQKSLAAGLNGNVEAVFVMDLNKRTDFIPKNMLEKDSSNSFLQLMDLKSAYNFEPSTDAVMLDEEAKKLSSKIYSGLGSIKMTSYNPEIITYESESEEKQLAVFSEIYYSDGWKAFVDGAETPIVKVDYLLRGVEIPAGKHKITLKYVSPFYKTANTLSAAGSILLLLLVGVGCWTDRKKVKQG